MTQEQKDLLLKDLCARLPYGVVIQEKCVEHDKTFLPNKEVDRLVNIDVHADSLMTNCGSLYYLDEIKPYLFPLSSITDEQKYTCPIGVGELEIFIENANWSIMQIMPDSIIPFFDWLHKKHFDYRGLIEKGLAIDATGLNIY